MMSFVPLFVVTLNWNLAKDTIACVESVLNAGVVPTNIVIVDNGSTDASVQAFSAHFGRDLPLVCNQRNLGFARGMNSGIRYALERGAGSVLMLNNDTVIAPTMIEALIDAAAVPSESGADAGPPDILGPAIYCDAAPDRLWKLGDVEHRWLPMPLSIRPSQVRLRGRDHSASPNRFPVDYVTGCCMLVRRQVFERIGLLDPRYLMYFEDADFCRRARDAGFTVWCVPRAKMWHKVSLSAQRDRPRNRYHRALGQVRFYREHPHGSLAVLRTAYIAAKTARTLFGDVWRRDWDLIVPLLRGTIDGYKENA